MRLKMVKDGGSITPDELGAMWFKGATLFICWDATSDLAQATWDWPLFETWDDKIEDYLSALRVA